MVKYSSNNFPIY